MEQKLYDIEIELYNLFAPAANYVRAYYVVNLVFLQIMVQLRLRATPLLEKLIEISKNKKVKASLLTAITFLFVLEQEINDLNEGSIYKTLFMINSLNPLCGSLDSQ